jgi:uncharacterized protein
MHQTSRTALITDATAGLGREFATQLARRGYDLVLVGSSSTRLDALAATIRANHRVRTQAIAVELGARDAVARIGDGAARMGTPIDVLVADPGFAPAGRYSSAPPPRSSDMLMVNLTKLTGLTRGLAAQMADRRSGAIINVGPVFGTDSAHGPATYGAATTFILNLSLALHTDYHQQGVRVTALTPWPVDSTFLDVAAPQPAFGGRVITPRGVVRGALKAVGCDQAPETPSLAARVTERFIPQAERLLPAI